MISALPVFLFIFYSHIIFSVYGLLIILFNYVAISFAIINQITYAFEYFGEIYLQLLK